MPPQRHPSLQLGLMDTNGLHQNGNPNTIMPRPQMPSGNSFDLESNKRGRDGSAGERSSTPRDKNGDKDAPPSVLVREKKQKACANCRRAKLKCIVEGNETDCVRCRARKERCIFYPRGHDEDWQQTLTADVYNALGHLSHLTSAVQHMLHHLNAQGIVPPLDSPLQRYDVPDRDLSVLQGWSGDRNRELATSLGDRKRRRTKADDDNGDDQDQSMPMAPFPADYSAVDARTTAYPPQLPPSSLIRPGDVHTALNYTPGPLSANPLPGSQTPSHRLSSHSQTPQLISDVDLGAFGFPQDSKRPKISPEIPISPVDFASNPGSVPSSGVVATSENTPYSAPSQQGGIFGLLNGVKASTNTDNIPAQAPSYASDSFGSADPRPNIVKRGIISNSDALDLVNYFHNKLSPWLFGYRLEFGKFPYIPNGPSVMTPFILGVMCLIAAERMPTKHKHQRVLGTEVNQLLVNSPADSFISTLESPFGGGPGVKDEDGEEELDPELGIGPEEIVGACILATFMTDRESAATIASSAFKWARGWIKWTSLTVPLPPTLGEVCGLLPVKRDATREDMARVWLLCYIVDGTEALQRNNPTPPRRDPMAYCQVLVPDSPLQKGDSYSPHDILLTFHARLITLLRDWYHRRASDESMPPSRLASHINAQLEWWRADLEAHGLGDDWMRYINLFWEFARMLVNATSAKQLAGNRRLSAASWAIGVEAAVGFLEKCMKWPNKEDLANLPPCYLNMTTLAGSVLVDAIKEQGADSPFQADDAVPLLGTVADMLCSGGLPQNHVSRNAGQTLRGFAETLAGVRS